MPPILKWCVSRVLISPKALRLPLLQRLPPISVLLVSLLSHYSESASWHSLLRPLTVTQPMWQECARGLLWCFSHTKGRQVHKLCVFILQPEFPNGKMSGGFASRFFVVTSSPNAQDGYSKSGQMDWLIHREEGNAISLNDKPLNELMACDRRREEWERMDNLWVTGRERRTLEIVTEGKNAWPGMNNIALSTFICLQASIIHVHAQTEV